MRKNELTNRRLVSALTVGISAMMALATPITAYANGEATAPVDDNPTPATESNASSQTESAPAVTEPAEAQAEVVQEAVAAEPVQIENTDASQEQLQSAAVEAKTAANEILSSDTGAKAGEAGAVADAQINDVITAANAIVNDADGDPAALTSLGAAADKAGEVKQVLDEAGEADKQADVHEAEMVSEAKNVSDNVTEATKKADDMLKDTEETQKKADALIESINKAESAEDANKAYDDLTKLVDDTKFNLDALQTFYDGLLKSYNEAKGKLLEAEQNMQKAETEFSNKLGSADQTTQDAQQDIADAKEKVDKLADALDKVEDKLSDAADVEGLKNASGKDWAGKIAGNIDKKRGVMKSVVENYYMTQKLKVDLVRGEGYETTWQFIKEGDNDESMYSIDKQEYNYAKFTYYYKDEDGKIVQGTKYFNWDSIEKQYNGNWQTNANATAGDVIVVYEKTQDEYEANKLLNEKYNGIIKNTNKLRTMVNNGQMDVYVYEGADGKKEYIAIDDVNKMIAEGTIVKDADGNMMVDGTGAKLKLVVQNQNNLFHNANCLVVGSNARLKYYAYDEGSSVSGLLKEMLGDKLETIIAENQAFNDFITKGETTANKNAAKLSGKYADFDTATYKAEQAVAIARQEADKLSDAIDELKSQKKRSTLAVDVLGVDDVASHFGIEVSEEEAAKLNDMTVRQVLDELDKLLEKSNKKVETAQSNLTKLQNDFGQAKTDLDATLLRLNPVRPVTVQVSGDVAGEAAQRTADNAAAAAVAVTVATPSPAAVVAAPSGDAQQEAAPVVDQRRAARQASADALTAGGEENASGAATTIEDGGVALAETAETETGELKEEINEAAVSIEDEDTAKGLLEEAPVQEENMSFWWLLLIALLGEAGREMYVKHKKKQEEKAKIED